MKTFTAQDIIDELKERGEFSIPGVGKLKVKERAARVGRNPRTGETVNIAAKNAVTFKTASKLNDVLN